MRLDHIELVVPHPKQATAWYQATLGFKILPQHYHRYEEGGPLMIPNDEGQTMLALFAGQSQRDAPAGRFRRIAFRVGAHGFIGCIQSSAAWRGKALNRSDIKDPDQSISVEFSDPCGNLLELTSYEPEIVRSHFRNPPTAQGQ